MPVYEFKCKCGNEKEELVKLNTKSIKCNKCGKDMTKYISLSSFHLKGNGWASDLYGSKKIKKNTNK